MVHEGWESSGTKLGRDSVYARTIRMTAKALTQHVTQRRALEKKQRELEEQRRRLERIVVGGSAGIGGAIALAKWPILLELFNSVFRIIGGPILVSAAIRTPGAVLLRLLLHPVT